MYQTNFNNVEECPVCDEIMEDRSFSHEFGIESDYRCNNAECESNNIKTSRPRGAVMSFYLRSSGPRAVVNSSGNVDIPGFLRAATNG